MDEAVNELVAEVTDVALNGDVYERAGVAFATKPSDGAVEVRLGEEIAEAATRTPDTTASPRGPGWVRFAPREFDEHAHDRLDAWFLVAWRMAGDNS